uniref:Uncharacterized protein n=1 Tax=Alexandrium monilatum TaxID=311494 RepID=A0A7S4RMB7_9DINO
MAQAILAQAPLLLKSTPLHLALCSGAARPAMKRSRSGFVLTPAGWYTTESEAVRRNLTEEAFLHDLEAYGTRTVKLDLKDCRQLSDAAVQAVAERCQGLAQLNVANCHRLTDAALLAVAESCPGLAQLDISGCPGLTDAAAVSVVRSCPSLVVLDARWCTGLSISKKRSMDPLGYYRQLQQAAVTSDSAKVLLVGPGMAGKTSVARALQHGPGAGALTALEERTMALEQATLWDQMHLYDFGGQPEYYPWHRLFLTPEALYLVFTVAGQPLEQLQREVQEQLQHLLCTAGAVPVLLVLGKADMAEDPAGLEDAARALKESVRAWAAKMSALSVDGQPLRVPLILGAHVVSASTGRGLPDLQRAMRLALLATDDHGARLLPRFKALVPESYERVRGLLRAVMYREDVATALACEPTGGGLLRAGEPPSVCFLRFDELLKALQRALEDTADEVRRPFLAGGPETVLRDALSLFEGEGLILRTGAAGAEGLVHLDPSWLVDAVRGLADHRLCARYGKDLQERTIKDLARTWEQAKGSLSSSEYEGLLRDYARTGVAKEALLHRLFEPAMSGYGLQLAELRKIFEELDMLFETGEDGACVVPVQLDDTPPGGFEEECELGAGSAFCEVVGTIGLGYLPPGFTQRLIVDMRRKLGEYHRCFSLGGVIKQYADSETKAIFFFDLERCQLTLRAQAPPEGRGREAHRVALHQRVNEMKEVVHHIARQWAGLELTFTADPVVNFEAATHANEKACAKLRLRGLRVHSTFKSEDALDMMVVADGVQQAGASWTWVHNGQRQATWFKTWRQKCMEANIIVVLFTKKYRDSFTDALKQEATVIKGMYESKLAKLYVLDPEEHSPEVVQVNLLKGAEGMGDIGAWLGFLTQHGVN